MAKPPCWMKLRMDKNNNAKVYIKVNHWHPMFWISCIIWILKGRKIEGHPDGLQMEIEK